MTGDFALAPETVASAKYAGNEAVYVTNRNDTTYSIWPVTFTFNPVDPIPFASLRLRAETDSVEMIVVGSGVEYIPWANGSTIVASAPSLGSMISREGAVSPSQCVADIAACTWSSTFRNDNYELCWDELQWYAGSPGCSRDSADYSLLWTPRVMLYARPALPTLVSRLEWFLEYLVASHSYVVQIQADETCAFSDFEFVTVDDVSKPCLCPPSPTLLNSSTVNIELIARATSLTRLAVQVNDPVVAESSLFGTPYIGRGIAITVSPLVSVLYPLFADPLPVTRVRPLSIFERKSGLPTCDRNVAPARCSVGTCGRYESLLSTIDQTCECTATSCSCGSVTCTFDGDEPSCPGADPAFLQEMKLARLAAMDGCVGWIDRVSPGEETTAANDNGNFTFTAANQTWPQLLVSIELPSCDASSVVLKARPDLFSDEFDTVAFEDECVDGKLIILPLYDVDAVYSTWRLLTDSVDAEATGQWSPSGVPVSRAVGEGAGITAITASSESSAAQNLMWHDFTTWTSTSGPSFVRYDLAGATQITHFMVDARSIGLPVFNETDGQVAGRLTVRLRLRGALQPGLSSTATQGWIPMGLLKSDVYEGRERFVLATTSTQKVWSVKLDSAHTMSLREFVVYTNQRFTCNATITKVGSDPGSTIPSIVEFERQRSLLLDASQPCISTNECTIGIDGTTCNDEIAVAARLKLSRVPVFQTTLGNAFSLVSGDSFLFFNITDALPIVAVVAGWFNVTAPTQEDADIFAATGVSANWTMTAVYQNGTVPAYLLGGALTATLLPVSPIGNFTSLSTLGNFYPFPPGTVCPAGTQYILCGPSNRLVDVAPGIQCESPALFTSIWNDVLNRTDFVTREFRTIRSFADGGDTVQFYVTVPLSTLNVSTSECDGADCAPGLTRCVDGSCSSTCSGVRYSVPGNGCLRVTSSSRDFYCACDDDHGGPNCASKYTLHGTELPPRTPAHLVPACGGPPPIAMTPPFGTTYRVLSKSDIDAINQAAWLPGDVTDSPNSVMQYTFAPFFLRFPRSFERNGQTFTTTCPYLALTPQGVGVTIFQSARWEPTTRRWVPIDFERDDGTTTQIIWRRMTDYDELPFRCTTVANNNCVKHQYECLLPQYARPVPGKCLVTGKRECDPGQETFLQTEPFSQRIRIAYASEDGISAPTRPGYSENSQAFGESQCRARDCSTQDCGPPFVCITDKNRHDVSCKNAPYIGKCGVDLAACLNGDVYDPVACNRKGVPRRRDYRDPADWYCECGDPASRLQEDLTNIRETVELKKNGWGGLTCSTYLCDEGRSTLRYSTHDPITGKRHLDAQGLPLPGIWTGFCGNKAIGPDPDEFESLAATCPGVDRPERCAKVPCRIAGVVRTDVLATECQALGGDPLVYPCNNKGDALADGTCACDSDPTTGRGYAPDFDKFSYLGCYRMTTCGRSLVSNKVCNAIDAYDTTGWVAFPKIPYLEQQVPALVARLGFPMTNESIVRLIAPSLQRNQDLILQAAAAIAERTRSDVAGFALCICATPDPDTDEPRMITPVAEPFMKSFARGYYIKPTTAVLLNSTNSRSADILFNGEIVVPGAFMPRPFGSGQIVQSSMFTPEGFSENADYLTLVSNLGGSFNTLQLNFSRPVTVQAVRLQGFYLLNESNPLTIDVQVTNAAGALLCRADVANVGFRIGQMSDWEWIGDDKGVYCGATYLGYDFRRLQKELYATNCQDVGSTLCLDWQDDFCETIGGTVQTSETLSRYQGCSPSSRCCQRITEAIATSQILIRIESSLSNVLLTQMRISELQIFAYASEIEPAPPGLLEYLSWKTGDATEGQCLDQRYLSDPRILGADQQYFPLHDYTPNQECPDPIRTGTYETGDAECADMSGHLATASGSEAPGQTAVVMGQYCFEDVANDTITGCTTNGQPLKNLKACLVAAKNRHDPTAPPTAYFLLPICTASAAGGCYVPSTLPFPKADTEDTYAASRLADARYRTTPTYGSVSWTQVHERLNAVYQVQSSRTLSNSYTTDITLNTGALMTVRVMEAMRGVTYKTWIRSQQSYQSFTGFITPPKRLYGITTGQFAPIIPQLGVQTGPSRTTFWTNDQSCLIRFYTRQVGGYATQFGTHGVRNAYKAYRISTADDYSQLFRNLMYDTFNQCVSPNDYSPVGQATCDGLSQPLLGRIVSFSIEGPCALKFECNTASTSSDECNAAQDPNTGVWSVATSGGKLKTFYVYGEPHIATEVPVGTERNYEVDAWLGTTQWSYGLWPECYIGDVCTGNGLGVSPTQSNANAPIHSSNALFSVRAGYMKSVVIIPQFASSKMEMKIRAPANGWNEPDAETMGYLSHPYAPFGLYMAVTKRFKASVFRNPSGGDPLTGQGTGSVPANVVFMLNIGSVEANAQAFDTSLIVINDGAVPVWWMSALPNAGEPLIAETTLNTMLLFSSFRPFAVSGLSLCTACRLEQPFGSYEWDARVLSRTSTRFPVIVQDGPATRPVIYTHFQTGEVWQTLESLELTNPKAFARLSCDLRGDEYKTRFSLNQCLQVNKVGSQYRFEAVVCQERRPLLCIRDVTKNTVQSGYQCFDNSTGTPYGCGDSLRVGGAVTEPPEDRSCYAQFALANPSTNPFAWSVYQASIAGTLPALVATANIDYDQVYAYMRDLPNSLFIALPTVPELLAKGYSDRPNLMSEGQRSAPFDWIDTFLKRMLPVDCGIQCGYAKGTCRHRIAREQRYCDPDAPQDYLPLMAPADIPLIFRAVDASLDATLVPSCGFSINPATYDVEDAVGPAQPNLNWVVVERGTTGGVRIKPLQHEAVWYNVLKWVSGYRFVFGVEATVTGRFECSSCVGVTVTTFVAPLNDRGLLENIIDIGTTNLDGTAVDWSFALNSTREQIPLDEGWPNVTRSVVGWRFEGLSLLNDLWIRNALITDADSIAKCRTDRSGGDWYNPPSSMDVGNPQNTCVDTVEKRNIARVDDLGVCYCPSAAYGGAECDRPTTDGPFGKHVCNNYGAVGPYGNIVADPDGSGFDPLLKKYLCKPSDYGLNFLTRLHAQNAFDYSKVLYITPLPAVEDRYVVVDPPNDVARTIPQTRDQLAAECAAESGLIPYYLNGDDLDLFLDATADILPQTLVVTNPDRNNAVGIDLYRDTGDFVWSAPLLLFRRCNESSPCGELGDPCSDSASADCHGCNVNNKLFLTNSIVASGAPTASPTPALVDGKKEYNTYPDLYVATITLVPAAVEVDVRVIMLISTCTSTPAVVRVADDASSTSCDALGATSTSRSWLCTNPAGKNTEKIAVTMASDCTIMEIQTMVDADEMRCPYYDY